MIAEFECYDAMGELMPADVRKIAASFYVEPTPDAPYVLGIWVDVGPGRGSGRTVVPVYLTQEQKAGLVFVTHQNPKGI